MRALGNVRLKQGRLFSYPEIAMRQFSPANIVSRRSVRRVAHLDSTLPHDLADLLWRRPESLANHSETLQRSGLRWTIRLTWDCRQYVLKHYQPDWWQASKGLVQPSRA